MDWPEPGFAHLLYPRVCVHSLPPELQPARVTSNGTYVVPTGDWVWRDLGRRDLLDRHGRATELALCTWFTVAADAGVLLLAPEDGKHIYLRGVGLETFTLQVGDGEPVEVRGRRLLALRLKQRVTVRGPPGAPGSFLVLLERMHSLEVARALPLLLGVETADAPPSSFTENVVTVRGDGRILAAAPPPTFAENVVTVRGHRRIPAATTLAEHFSGVHVWLSAEGLHLRDIHRTTHKEMVELCRLALLETVGDVAECSIRLPTTNGSVRVGNYFDSVTAVDLPSYHVSYQRSTPPRCTNKDDTWFATTHFAGSFSREQRVDLPLAGYALLISPEKGGPLPDSVHVRQQYSCSNGNWGWQSDEITRTYVDRSGRTFCTSGCADFVPCEIRTSEEDCVVVGGAPALEA